MSRPRLTPRGCRRVKISLPRELVDRIDAVLVGCTYKRSEFVRRLIERELVDIADDEARREMARRDPAR